MKRFLQLLFALMLPLSLMAQVPQGINYQAIVRDVNDQPLLSTPVSVRFTVSNGGGSFVETHSGLTTSSIGIVDVVIGSVNIAGFVGFDWSSTPTSIQVEVDPDGPGPNLFSVIGSQTLESVPYALVAQSTNEIMNVPVDLSSLANGDQLIYDLLGNKFVTSQPVSSPWGISGSTVYYTAGTVGVGTSIPVGNLEVQANADVLARISTVSGNASLELFRQGASNIDYLLYSDSNDDAFKIQYSNNDMASVTTAVTIEPGIVRIGEGGASSNLSVEGNVGIGVSTALAKLDVRGNIIGYIASHDIELMMRTRDPSEMYGLEVTSDQDGNIHLRSSLYGAVFNSLALTSDNNWESWKSIGNPVIDAGHSPSNVFIMDVDLTVIEDAPNTPQILGAIIVVRLSTGQLYSNAITGVPTFGNLDNPGEWAGAWKPFTTP